MRPEAADEVSLRGRTSTLSQSCKRYGELPNSARYAWTEPGCFYGLEQIAAIFGNLPVLDILLPGILDVLPPLLRREDPGKDGAQALLIGVLSRLR